MDLPPHPQDPRSVMRKETYINPQKGISGGGGITVETWDINTSDGWDFIGTEFNNVRV